MDCLELSGWIVKIIVILSHSSNAQFVTPPSSNVAVCSGDDQLLNWEYEGPTDVTTVFWYQGTTVIMNKIGTNAGTPQGGADVEYVDNGKITLKTVEAADAAEYSIVVDYTGASGRTDLTSTTTVAVNVAPTGLTGSSSVSGSDTTYTCSVTTSGTPAVTVKIKVGGVLQSTSSMVVNDASLSVDCCADGDAAACLADTCVNVYTPVTTAAPSKKNKTGAIVGGVIGSLAGVCVAIGVGYGVYSYKIKNKAGKSSETKTNPDPERQGEPLQGSTNSTTKKPQRSITLQSENPLTDSGRPLPPPPSKLPPLNGTQTLTENKTDETPRRKKKKKRKNQVEDGDDSHRTDQSGDDN